MTLKRYTTGFTLSLLLTLASAGLVYLHISNNHEWPPHSFIIPAILLFALLQCVVQGVYFLHLGERVASRERRIALGSALVVISILVGGSLWIMTTLNSRMMPSDMQMQYMSSQQGL